jgi:hypothetical protein
LHGEAKIKSTHNSRPLGPLQTKQYTLKENNTIFLEKNNIQIIYQINKQHEHKKRNKAT